MVCFFRQGQAVRRDVHKCTKNRCKFKPAAEGGKCVRAEEIANGGGQEGEEEDEEDEGEEGEEEEEEEEGEEEEEEEDNTNRRGDQRKQPKEQEEEEDEEEDDEDEEDEGAEPLLTAKSKWISWRILQPFVTAKKRSETLYEQALRAHESKVLQSGGTRKRGMGELAKAACAGTVAQAKLASLEPIEHNNKRRRRRR